MPNLFDEKQTNDLFAGVAQDDDMDLSQFIRPSKKSDTASLKQSATSTDVKAEIPDTKKSLEVDSSTSPITRELERQRNQQRGMSISREEFEAGKERTEFHSPVESDRRINDIEQALTDTDIMLKKRAAIIPLKQYENPQEYTQMVHEISLVEFDENGKAYIKYEVDDEGRKIGLSMIRLRTENDPPFDKENDFLQMQRDNANRQRIAMGQEPIGNDVPLKAPVADVVPENAISEEKQQIVQFIIDKTGLGADFVLTEDEKTKLVEANEIRLTQVEVLDIASITTVKPDRESFTGKIHEYNLSSSKTTVSFPASGFKADMVGLTYGEIGDISLSMDSINVDKYYKRLAIIYNKMKNISSGPFDSFESFLKNIAYTDISMAMYGLYVSTFPEIQGITLNCGREGCKKSFDWNFSTRNILQLQKSDEVYLNHLKEIAYADPDEYDDIYKKAPVRNIKYIRLPKCGYIVGVGIASAWEFLYNFIPVLDETNFKNAFGDDLNSVYANNVLLLTSVLSVRVPDPKRPGTYILCEGYKDILDAIYNINPEEIKVLASICAKIQQEYQVYFSFTNIVCPHCKHATDEIEVTMDELLFQTYQRLMSTEIDLTNIRGI